MTDRRDRYRQLCSNNKMPLHLQALWLDAVCGENGWEVVFAGNPDRPEGVWPFPKHDLYRRVGLPPFTSYGGPWLFYPEGAKRSTLYGFDKKVLTELAAGLPRWVFFRQNLLPEITNVLPLIWTGFKTSTRYTYRLYPGTGVAAWWESLESEMRKKIKAEEPGSVLSEEDDPALLWHLHAASLQRMGVRAGGSEANFLRVYKAMQENGSGRLLVVRKADQPVAAQWLVTDHSMANFILSGKAVEQSYANYLLLAHCVRWALENSYGVDFEGSMRPSLEHVYRKMGGVLTPYFRVRRY
ncbi:MAG: GNAT family N-acetyltransferase [Saprospiraceae bacterium]|nr:GNAT family N-acetyltransferase [Saprospiraceae bacterium]